MSKEDKIQKLFEFAMSMRHDPDFHRLVFPPAVLAKLAEAGSPLAPKEYSAAAAVDRCFNMKGTERYASNEIEVIDQSKMEIAFPAIPPVEPLSLPEEETKTEEKQKTTETDVFTVVEEAKNIVETSEPTLHIKD
jgi:hypothetical protein